MDDLILGPHSLIPELYTHQNQDFDSMVSAYIPKRHTKKMKHARVVLVPASWDGSGMRDCDMAVDLEAGGRGIKGTKETLPNGSVIVHSSARYLFDKYVSKRDRQALEAVVELADLHDAYRSAIDHLIPGASGHAKWLFRNTDIIKIFRFIQSAHKDDPYLVMERMFEIFDGYIKLARSERSGKRKKSFNASLKLSHLYEEYLAEENLSERDQRSLEAVAELADLHNTHGSAVDYLLSDYSDDVKTIFGDTGLVKIFQVIQFVYRSQPNLITERMFEIFDGYIRDGEDKRLGKEEARRARRFAGGRVALVIDKQSTKTDYVIWGEGADAIVFVDHAKNSIGVLRNKFKDSIICNDGTEFVTSHPLIRAVIEAVGETIGESGAFWFVHPGNWLFAHGSMKAAQAEPSKVHPMDLINVLIKLFGTDEDSPICGLD